MTSHDCPAWHGCHAGQPWGVGHAALRPGNAQANQELAQQVASCKEAAAALTAGLQQEVLGLQARLKGCSCRHAAAHEEPRSTDKLAACCDTTSGQGQTPAPGADGTGPCQLGITPASACSNAGLEEDPGRVPLDGRPPRYTAAGPADRGRAAEAPRSCDYLAPRSCDYFVADLVHLLDQ